ncbi:unnamed protein product [Brassica oleracea var. botrytis]|uniref:Uncharacterized protein n=2 Tax=Brassica TaxID=3705 RepID=A0A3P6G9P2_BRAOL|nr:unnamed protein product [Brassica napus]VDD62648.1 unnamed protein product [Brassica oleracea]
MAMSVEFEDGSSLVVLVSGFFLRSMSRIFPFQGSGFREVVAREALSNLSWVCLLFSVASGCSGVASQQRVWVVPSVCVSWSPWCGLVTTALQSWCVLGGVALLSPSLSPCEPCYGLGFSVCALGLWCRISFTESFGFLVHLVALLRRGGSLHV